MAARSIALIRVEYPLPYFFSQASTSRSSRTAISCFDFGLKADASCSSDSGGISEWSISDSGLVASRSSTCCCRFVSGLLKIDSAFMLISLAGRDDADDLFAIFRLPVNMHDNQEKPASDHSQGVPSLFPSSSILSSISTMFGSSNTRAAVLKPSPCFLYGKSTRLNSSHRCSSDAAL